MPLDEWVKEQLRAAQAKREEVLRDLGLVDAVIEALTGAAPAAPPAPAAPAAPPARKPGGTQGKQPSPQEVERRHQQALQLLQEKGEVVRGDLVPIAGESGATRTLRWLASQPGAKAHTVVRDGVRRSVVRWQRSAPAAQPEAPSELRPEAHPPGAPDLLRPPSHVAERDLAIYNYIKQNGPTLRRDISRRFELVGADLTRTRQRLENQYGLRQVEGPLPPGGGRRQVVYLLPDQSYQPGAELAQREQPEPEPEPEVRVKQRVHPGAEGLPEHLRGLPAAEPDIPVSVRVKHAEVQLAVLRYVGEGVATAPLMAQADKGTGDHELPDKTVAARHGHALRELEEAGLVSRAGHEHGPWQQQRGGPFGGRPSIAYRLTDQGRQVLALVPPREAAPAATAPTAPTAPELTLEVVRDAVTAMASPVSPGQLVVKLGELLPEATAVDARHLAAHLATLVERGVLRDISPTEDQPLYEYQKPSGPGSAATVDAERAKAANGGTREAAAPVPGTGRAERAPRADVDALLRAARGAGAEVKRTGSDHFLVVLNNRRAVIAGTPSSGGLQRDKLKLRNIGVPV